MREWFTAQELRGLSDVPKSIAGIHKAADREGWQKRKRAKGKGFEYHISSLPVKARAELGEFGHALTIAADQSPAPAWVRWLARLLRPVVLEIIRQEIRDA
jgi:hypothetical protein